MDSPSKLKIITNNNYVRATCLVAILTAFAGLQQANINGFLWLFALSGVFLGFFLLIILFVLSISSVIKELRQQTYSTNRNVSPGFESQPGSAKYYKKRLVWSIILSVPGVLLMIASALTTKNGGGEAFIVFIPLFLLSFVSLMAAFIFGVIFLYKRNKVSNS